MSAAEQGFRADITAFPSGDWPTSAVGDQPICRVVFSVDANVARDATFAQVLKRRTNRSNYEAAPPTMAEGDAVHATMAKLPVQFGWTSDVGQVARLRDIAKRAWDVEVNKDATYFESVRVYRVTAEDILKHRDGLSFHGPFFWSMHALGLFTKEQALSGDATMRQQSRDYVNDQLAHTPSLAWIVTQTNDRRAQLAAGAAYVRANLKATEIGLAMAPLSQALQEYPEMLPLLAEHKRALGLPESDTVQMFFRLGRAATVEPAPRRPLDAIIRA